MFLFRMILIYICNRQVYSTLKKKFINTPACIHFVLCVIES